MGGPGRKYDAQGGQVGSAINRGAGDRGDREGQSGDIVEVLSDSVRGSRR